jgi:hypothetical protein
VEAQAEQANERDKKQDDVGGEEDDIVERGNVHVGCHANTQRWYQFRANLVMMSSEGPLQFKVVIHPHDGW